MIENRVETKWDYSYTEIFWIFFWLNGIKLSLCSVMAPALVSLYKNVADNQLGSFPFFYISNFW